MTYARGLSPLTGFTYISSLIKYEIGIIVTITRLRKLYHKRLRSIEANSKLRAELKQLDWHPDC